jgi:hypothetical protein
VAVENTNTGEIAVIKIPTTKIATMDSRMV